MQHAQNWLHFSNKWQVVSSYLVHIPRYINKPKELNISHYSKLAPKCTCPPSQCEHEFRGCPPSQCKRGFRQEEVRIGPFVRGPRAMIKTASLDGVDLSGKTKQTTKELHEIKWSFVRVSCTRGLFSMQSGDDDRCLFLSCYDIH